MVSDTGSRVRPKLVQSDSTGRTYRVAVPAGQAVSVVFSSRQVRFLDAGGKALSFPHTTVSLPSQRKEATARIVVTAQALTAVEKDQVKLQ